MKIKFTVLGEPQGKGRPIFGGKTKAGTPITRTPDKTVFYENLIITEYRRQVGSAKFEDNTNLDMRITAYYTIPASASKKKQKQMENGEIRPTKKPDMDNIVKVVADSLNSIAYRDDAQIVDCQIRKFYSRQPRIEVTILTAASR
ncbi:MAG: RusA family crossover junction endodeoxyribonuclease [Smithella sp.]